MGFLLFGMSSPFSLQTTFDDDLVQGGFIGRIFDIYGPRPLMISGTLCYAVSVMMTSLSTKYYQYILAQGVLFGLGVGLLYVLVLSSAFSLPESVLDSTLPSRVSRPTLGGIVRLLWELPLLARV